MRIVGPGADRLTIDASGIDPTPEEHNGDGGRVLLLVPTFYEEQHELEISGLAIRGGDMGFGNSTHVSGGGIFAESVRLVLRDSKVSDNHSQTTGGGVYIHTDQSQAASLIERTVITGNRAEFGGGLGLIAGEFQGIVVRDSLIANNEATFKGGGLSTQANSFYNVPIALENSTVSGNMAPSAAGMYAGYDASLVSVRRSTITNNTATTLTGVGGVLANGGVARVEPFDRGVQSDSGRTVERYGSGARIAIRAASDDRSHVQPDQCEREFGIGRSAGGSARCEWEFDWRARDWRDRSGAGSTGEQWRADENACTCYQRVRRLMRGTRQRWRG